MSLRWVVMGVAGASLVLGACGGGSFDEETIKRLDAAQAQLDETLPEGLDSDAGIDADAEQCLADRTTSDLDDLSRAVLGDAGASGDASRLELLTALIDCVPDLADLDSFVDPLAATMDLALGPEVDVDREVGTCLVTYVLENAVDPAEALAIGSSLDSQQVWEAALVECLDDEALANARGDAGTGPQSYGDDPDFDRLSDLCTQGDNRACDLLFFEASQESGYQNFAGTCGDRTDGLEFCSPDLLTDADGYVATDSPGLSILETECSDGDMNSCDLLFLASPPGSEFENAGLTCGGRIAIGAVPNCRTRFAN